MKKLWSAINEKSYGQQLGEPPVFQNEANGIMTTDAALKNRLNCFPSPDIPSLERRSNALRGGISSLSSSRVRGGGPCTNTEEPFPVNHF